MRIVLADDSALLRGIIRAVLGSADDIVIAGEATNGRKALEMVTELRPDLVIMDVNMPVMDGIEATKLIMNTIPTPVLVFTSEDDAEKGFEAIESGAIEILKKPPIDQLNDPVFEKLFIDKIRTLAQKKSVRRPEPVKQEGLREKTKRRFPLIAIGASTGGPVAVRRIFKALPKNLPCGIALVQHLESGFDGGYVDWLNEASPLDIILAEREGRFMPGTVVVAPADYHLRCVPGGYVLDKGAKVVNQRPSVDVLFSSAADRYGPDVLGVLLTGMGRDGADGCVAIKASGGYTICQDESTSAIFGMPKAAIELKGASTVLPLDEITQFIRSLAE